MILYDNYTRQRGWGTLTPSIWEQHQHSLIATQRNPLLPLIEYDESYLYDVPLSGMLQFSCRFHSNFVLRFPGGAE